MPYNIHFIELVSVIIMTIVPIMRCSMFINTAYCCTGVQAGLSRVVTPCMIPRYCLRVDKVHRNYHEVHRIRSSCMSIQCCRMILSYALLNALTCTESIQSWMLPPSSWPPGETKSTSMSHTMLEHAATLHHAVMGDWYKVSDHSVWQYMKFMNNISDYAVLASAATKFWRLTKNTERLF